MSDRPPQAFYRVQHGCSFTHYDDEGFSTQASYIMDWCQWVSKEKFESHLDWKASPNEPTSYISLFDNPADAQKRAEFHVKQGRRGVFIAKVVPPALTLTSWLIRFSNVNIDLPVWKPLTITPSSRRALYDGTCGLSWKSARHRSGSRLILYRRV
jgi:hypothetical protein